MKDQWEYNRVYDAGIVIDGGGLQTTFQEKEKNTVSLVVVV